MQSWNVAEAKAHFSEILERVAAGEEILLTRRGQPIARVVPVQRTVSILGAGRQDPNINHEVIARDDWWKPLADDEAAESYA
jgi:prevent-host-death family protein